MSIIISQLLSLNINLINIILTKMNIVSLTYDFILQVINN